MSFILSWNTVVNIWACFALVVNASYPKVISVEMRSIGLSCASSPKVISVGMRSIGLSCAMSIPFQRPWLPPVKTWFRILLVVELAIRSLIFPSSALPRVHSSADPLHFVFVIKFFFLRFNFLIVKDSCTFFGPKFLQPKRMILSRTFMILCSISSL